MASMPHHETLKGRLRRRDLG